VSVRPSVTRVLCDKSKEPIGDIFIPHARAILLVKCDFSYSCAAADKISTDLRARAVSLRQLSYLLWLGLMEALQIGFVFVFAFPYQPIYCMNFVGHKRSK